MHTENTEPMYCSKFQINDKIYKIKTTEFVNNIQQKIPKQNNPSFQRHWDPFADKIIKLDDKNAQNYCYTR